MAQHTLRQVPRVIRNPHFWLVVVLFVIGVILHYPQQILSTDSLSLFTFLGLTRHAIERIFLLLPITYAAFFLGKRSGLITLMIALAIMLPRVFLLSLYLPDALLEASSVTVVGGLMNLWIARYRREQQRRQQVLLKLESAQQELGQMHDNLRFYIQQVTRAQEEERKRIARELHDDTAQELVALSRRLDGFISSVTTLSAQEISYLEELEQQTDNILGELRRFSQDLRPSILDDLGLVPALEWLTSDISNHFGIAVGMGVLGSVRRFPLETELVLFRIAQEALRNVWKHSEASRAWVTVEFGNDKAILTVKDNGKGCELPERVGDLASSGKLGLAGMQERAQLIGGKLTLLPEPGKGMSVTVEVQS